MKLTRSNAHEFWSRRLTLDDTHEYTSLMCWAEVQELAEKYGYQVQDSSHSEDFEFYITGLPSPEIGDAISVLSNYKSAKAIIQWLRDNSLLSTSDSAEVLALQYSVAGESDRTKEFLKYVINSQGKEKK